MNRVRGILLHICVVCSLVCVTAKILDWYNPYMDFTGHIGGIQMALYLSVIILGITRKYVSSKQGMKQKASISYAGGKYAHHNMQKLLFIGGG